MTTYALHKAFDSTDELLARTDNPLHRKILINWRKHACLEVMGRYEEILTPDMTVDHPVYRLTDHTGTTIVLDGREAVAGFYHSLVVTGATVMWPDGGKVAVGDWGFALESNFHRFIPGKMLAAGGEDVEDEDATYLVRNDHAWFWPYTQDGLMIGEHVYAAGRNCRTVTKIAPADVITPAQAVEILTPILAATPER